VFYTFRWRGGFSPGSLASIAKGGDLGRDALLTYARIPGDAERQINCLEAVFYAFRWRGDFSPESLAPIANRGDIGRDALLAYAKIPGNANKRINCLEAVFYTFGWDGDYSPEALASIAHGGALGRDALLTDARLPGDAERQINCLEACLIVRYGPGWYDLEQIDKAFVTVFLNITGTKRFRSGLQGMNFGNGLSVKVFYEKVKRLFR
jgi:hypothetical protein